MIGYLTFRNPSGMIAIIDELEEWCERKGFARVADLTGAMIHEPSRRDTLAAAARRSGAGIRIAAGERSHDHPPHHPQARRLAPARARRRHAQGGAAVHREEFRPRHPDAEPDPAGAHDRGRDRLSRARDGGAAGRLDLQAADDLLPHRRHRSRRCRARLPRGRVHRREALSRQRHHQFGRRRHRLQQDHARARAHGEDRHAVPDARRGRRSGDRHLRPRGDVHRALPVEMDEAVSRACA